MMYQTIGMKSWSSSSKSNVVFSARFFFGRGFGADSVLASFLGSFLSSPFFNDLTLFILLDVELTEQSDRFLPVQSDVHGVRRVD